MAFDLKSIVEQKNQQRSAWIEEKNQERETLNTLSEDGILMATESTEVYLSYLDVQAQNPTYSATNILIAMQQRNGITTLGSDERWKQLGRMVTKEARDEPIKIRVSDSYIKNGQQHTGYKTGLVYDVSQTSGRPIQPITLAEDSPEMAAAISALVRTAPVPIEIADANNLPSLSFYDAVQPTIFIQAGLSDSLTLQVLSKEIVHAWIHNKGAYEGYNRDECELDAESICYMMARRYGVPAEKPNCSTLAAQYDALETHDRRAMLGALQKMYKQIESQVSRELFPERDRGQNKSLKRDVPTR